LTTVLETKGLYAGYQGHPVVHDLDMEVKEGEVVGLLGLNGAGKTTTMLTLAGDLAPIAGEIFVLGTAGHAPLHSRARAGMSFVTEERSVFMTLSVAENLRIGRCEPALALELFPELKPLLRRTTGLLSGGEQQILALARALSRGSKLLLADELSLGLAPLVVRRLLDAVRQAVTDHGLAAVLVEQHVSEVTRIADHAYVMQRGRVVLSGTGEEVRAHINDIQMSYMAEASDTEAS
jgi:branched-chain amino acid transport system ATP-binding protein